MIINKNIILLLRKLILESENNYTYSIWKGQLFRRL